MAENSRTTAEKRHIGKKRRGNDAQKTALNTPLFRPKAVQLTNKILKLAVKRQLRQS
ncbi:MAG: hypothetical protein SOY07_10115 [Bacteroidales bacterium]|nr:hypothetical protein [Bacteroidales bacterium]